MERELTIMIIEDDIDACAHFASSIEVTKGLAITTITNNCLRALELVQESVPDVIILDLELHSGEGNGLKFLNDLKGLSIPFKPYILITTNNTSSVTYEAARNDGADFIMSKHKEDYSEENVVAFLKMMKDIIQHNNVRSNPLYTTNESEQQREKRYTRIITIELDKIGINPKNIGYKYLTDAILLTLEEKRTNISTLIGQKYNKTNFSVERAMQNAINRAWRTNDINELYRNYTAIISSEKGVPTITEFIYYYANKIQTEY